MSTTLNDYDSIKTEIKKVYSELLGLAKENDFYKQTVEQTETAISNLAISDEKKSELLIQFYAQITSDTIGKTFDQSITFVSIASKLTHELANLAKDGILKQAQIDEIDASIDIKEYELEFILPQQKNNLEKDEILKQAQIDEIDASIDIKEYELESILPQQKKNLGKDETVKDNQAKLIERQKAAYDDNLKVEKSKSLHSLVFPFAMGGLVVPTDLQEDAIKAAKDIVTP